MDRIEKAPKDKKRYKDIENKKMKFEFTKYNPWTIRSFELSTLMIEGKNEAKGIEKRARDNTYQKMILMKKHQIFGCKMLINKWDRFDLPTDGEWDRYTARSLNFELVDGLKQTVETVSEDTRKANMCHFLNMATSAGTDLLSQVAKFRRAKFLGKKSIPPPEQTDFKVRVQIAKKSSSK